MQNAAGVAVLYMISAEVLVVSGKLAGEHAGPPCDLMELKIQAVLFPLIPLYYA